MRRLAVKIFLSFWLIHAVIFVVLGLVRSERGPEFLVKDVRRHGRMAVEMLDRDGPQGCATLLSLFESHDGLRLTIYDGHQRVTCGSGTIEDGDATLAAKPDGYTERHGTRDLAVVRLGAPGGGSHVVVAATLPGIREDRAPGFPYDLLVTAAVVSGIVCFLLARTLTRPLGQVPAASRRLAAGDLAARAGARVGARQDEIGELVRDFDSMADRIASLIHAQSQLLSDISHELRSPLARLNVALELARRKAGGAAGTELDRIQTETERMNGLIGELLELSRAESDARAGRHEPVDLAEIVTEIVADADFEARRHGKSARLDIRSSAALEGDSALLARAIENVVRNAVRYTPAETAVDVVVAAEPGVVSVSVRDQGPGVPESDLEKIFAPFHRVESARSRGGGGAGLGLAIARRAVVLHGGTIVARNADGGGLLVTVRLPTQQPVSEPR